MEIEAVSNSKPGYTPIEIPKASAASASTADPARVEKSVAADQKYVAADDRKNMEKQQQGEKEYTPSEATINDAVKNANRKMAHTRCEYAYHKEVGRVSIKVINEDTDEVVREIPPEKALDMLQKMWEMAGILVDEKR